MRYSLFGDSLWGFVVIGGFVILAAAIAWAALRNRTSRRTERLTEDATRDLYKGDPVDRDSYNR
jgi:hypothetical protein